MSLENAKLYLQKFGFDKKIMLFDISSATVALASLAVGVSPAQIAKSLTFLLDGKCIMILVAGDCKVDNRLYKDYFGKKATMLTSQQVVEFTNHEIGGVCPFGIPSQISVYLDVSLKANQYVYPSCGTDNSAIKLTIDELEQLSNYTAWVDLTKKIVV
ncbi:MAG: YbaK/EbsC family protein [Clostridia bacterium]